MKQRVHKMMFLLLIDLSIDDPGGHITAVNKNHDRTALIDVVHLLFESVFAASSEKNAPSYNRSIVDRRTMRHAGQEISWCCWKEIHDHFRLMKMKRWSQKVKVRGEKRTWRILLFILTVYNLVRLPDLVPEALDLREVALEAAARHTIRYTGGMRPPNRTDSSRDAASSLHGCRLKGDRRIIRTVTYSSTTTGRQCSSAVCSGARG
jgi:hypothetical protein